jgi:hypothetical protein
MKSIIKLLAVLSLTTLTGCFDSSPSASDVRKEVEARFPSCDYFSVENFEKINGIKVSENEYDVYVSYDLKALPVKDGEKLLKDQLALVDAAYAAQQAWDKTKQEINSARRSANLDGISDFCISSPTVESCTKIFTSECVTSWSVSGIEKCATSPEFVAFNNKYNLVEFYKKRAELSKALQDASISKSKVEGNLRSMLTNACKSDLSFMRGNSQAYSDILMHGSTVSGLKDTIRMIKSDNGWVMTKSTNAWLMNR